LHLYTEIFPEKKGEKDTRWQKSEKEKYSILSAVTKQSSSKLYVAGLPQFF